MTKRYFLDTAKQSEKEELREQKRFNKLEKMIEKRETKELGRAVKRFGEGKENWL